ncbi:MAG: uracil-DNA glycosylase [Candidatus Nitronauta litoralis]|uniref:Type-4 uracil-DNA glycosylase n=1 Tax=Candidatus Nitronauta litoralis TaxID=2705533 RepID=A0A7T0G1J9_9BACT|nr:MAG: uracil-DNA glycosylase [Candidatus Nitronauta litoralis]
MLETPDRNQLILELKRYLNYLKDMGYDELPLATHLNLNASPPLTSTQTVVTPTSPMAKNPRQKVIKKPASVADSPKGLTGQAGLQAIQKEMGDCTLCKLSKGRKTIVFGSGNPNADLLFIGEGPGADEDEQGLPFVGRAGKKLTEIIEKGMKLSRQDDTYICNIVKCRPPGNRDPEKEEIEACKPFLQKQVQAVRPKVIVALGKPAATTLLGRNVAITKERGNWHEFEGVPLMLTFHPAYLLRAYTLENRQAVMDDMTQVLEALRK